MMRRFSLAFLLMMVCATSLAAQRRQPVFTSDPDMWVSGGIAGFTGNGVNDGRSASTWNFGNAWNWQYSASLERTLSGGGVCLWGCGAFLRGPVAVRGSGLFVGGGGACFVGQCPH